MNTPETSVRARLLEAGRKEFLIHGYERASLRKICAAAGVTTGALYFFFQNKEDLFDQVVGGTVEQLETLIDRMFGQELRDRAMGVENEKTLLEFLWNHREVIQILAYKAQGTEYENFVERRLVLLEQVFGEFFRASGVEHADEALIRILVRMKMQGYMEMIFGGYSLEKTIELAEQVGWYTDSGFYALAKALVHQKQKN